MKMKPGDKVTYHHEHRGGYGYVTKHPAVIVKILSKKIKIRVARINQEKKTYGDFACVMPEKLTPRNWIESFESILEGKE
jgi:hypothetical protein